MLDAQEDLLDEVGSLLLRKTLLFGNEVEELASAKPGVRKIKMNISWLEIYVRRVALNKTAKLCSAVDFGNQECHLDKLSIDSANKRGTCLMPTMKKI